MDCPFQVGDKVVCVRAFGSSRHGDTVPSVGDVLTVREVPVYGNIVYIRVIEIVNPVRLLDVGMAEEAFRTDHFRPVHTVDTTQTVAALKKTVRDVFEGERV